MLKREREKRGEEENFHAKVKAYLGVTIVYDGENRNKFAMAFFRRDRKLPRCGGFFSGFRNVIRK